MKNTITKIMIAISLGAMLLGMGSCYTARTAERQVDKAHHKYPEVPAKFCSERFPPLDSISIVKEYIQGEDIVYTDTLVERNYTLDTLILTKYITKTVKTTDTLRDTKFVQQENKSLLLFKDSEIKGLTEKVITLEQSRDGWRKWALMLAGILAAYVMFRIVKLYVFKK